MTAATGAAGRLAAAFIRSPLTPLFIAGSMASGSGPIPPSRRQLRPAAMCSALE